MPDKLAYLTLDPRFHEDDDAGEHLAKQKPLSYITRP